MRYCSVRRAVLSAPALWQRAWCPATRCRSPRPSRNACGLWIPFSTASSAVQSAVQAPPLNLTTSATRVFDWTADPRPPFRTEISSSTLSYRGAGPCWAGSPGRLAPPRLRRMPARPPWAVRCDRARVLTPHGAGQERSAGGSRYRARRLEQDHAHRHVGRVVQTYWGTGPRCAGWNGQRRRSAGAPPLCASAPGPPVALRAHNARPEQDGGQPARQATPRPINPVLSSPVHKSGVCGRSIPFRRQESSPPRGWQVPFPPADLRLRLVSLSRARRAPPSCRWAFQRAAPLHRPWSAGRVQLWARSALVLVLRPESAGAGALLACARRVRSRHWRQGALRGGTRGGGGSSDA